MLSLRMLRESRSLSQTALAGKARMNVSTVSAIECGRLVPTAKRAWRLAHALGVEPCEVRELAAVCEAANENPSGAAETARG